MRIIFNVSWPKRFFIVKSTHFEINSNFLPLAKIIGFSRILIIRMDYIVFKVFPVFQIIDVKRVEIFIEIEAWMGFVLLEW